MTSSSKSPRSRFSLQFLLAVTTFAAFVFAVWSSQIEPYRRQAAGFKRYNDLVHTDVQFLPIKMDLVSRADQTPGPLWKRLLVEFTLGESKFLQISNLSFPPGTDDDDIVYILRRMPFLKSVVVDRCDLSAVTMKCLSSLPQLTELDARYSDISDAELGELTRSSSLRRLVVTGNPITDQSVPTLASMQSLGELYIRWTQFSEDGFAELRKRKPACEIHFQAISKVSQSMESN